jgi:hypothetical protein
MTEDAVKVMKRNRKLVRDGNVVMDNAKTEAEILIAKSKALVAEHARSQAAQGLLEILPQGPGSGLDADMVDGLHAAEIISKAAIRGSGGGGGGSSNGNATKIQDKDVDITARVDDTILVFKSTSDSYIHETKGAPGAHASTHENGGGDEINVAGLSGELADPQPPKAHNQALSTITGHDKAAHDALGIDADTVDTYHAAALEKIANKGAANGYCGLDASALIALASIPTNLTGKNADQVDGCHAGLAANNVFKILAAIASGDIFYVDATPQIARLAKGSDGQVLKLVSGLPAWQTEGGGTSHDILSATHTDTLAAAVVRGDLIIANSTPKWTRLAVGLANKVLKSDGTDPAWGNVAHSELSGIGENDHHTKFTITEHDTTVRHALGTVVPHDALASLTEKSHTSLTDKGTNTHPQLDTHLAAAAPHSGHELTANKDQANGYAGLSAGSKLAAGQMPTGKVKTTLSFAVTGTLTTGTDKAPTLLAPCTLTITKVKLVVKTAPTGAAIIVDVNKNGTTIFTTQANRPQIAIGATTGDSGTPDVTSLAEGDKLTIDIDQVGSGTAGADLTIEVVSEQSVAFS